MCRDKKAYFYLRARCMADHWPEEFPNVNIYRRARRKRTLVPMFVSVIQRETRLFVLACYCTKIMLLSFLPT